MKYILIMIIMVSSLSVFAEEVSGSAAAVTDGSQGCANPQISDASVTGDRTGDRTKNPKPANVVPQ